MVVRMFSPLTVVLLALFCLIPFQEQSSSSSISFVEGRVQWFSSGRHVELLNVEVAVQPKVRKLSIANGRRNDDDDDEDNTSADSTSGSNGDSTSNADDDTAGQSSRSKSKKEVNPYAISTTSVVDTATLDEENTVSDERNKTMHADIQEGDGDSGNATNGTTASSTASNTNSSAASNTMGTTDTTTTSSNMELYDDSNATSTRADRGGGRPTSSSSSRNSRHNSNNNMSNNLTTTSQENATSNSETADTENGGMSQWTINDMAKNGTSSSDNPNASDAAETFELPPEGKQPDSWPMIVMALFLALSAVVCITVGVRIVRRRSKRGEYEEIQSLTV